MTSDEITCRQLVELVSDDFEGALDEGTLEVIEQHLILCVGCEAYVEQMKITLSLVRDVAIDESAPEPSAAVLAALRARRDGDDDDRS